MIKAIVFDFDGVISESMDVKGDAFLHVFNEYPQHARKILDLHYAHGGMSRFEKFRIVHEEILGIPYEERVGEKLAEKFGNYVYDRVVDSPYVAGAREFLKKYHGKFSFFIATGTPEEEMKKIARDKGIDKYFVEIFGSPTRKGEICKHILQKYNFSPDEVLMIGDSIDDYYGAQEAGIGFVGRIKNHNNLFEGTAAKAVIPDLTQLDKLI